MLLPPTRRASAITRCCSASLELFAAGFKAVLLELAAASVAPLLLAFGLSDRVGLGAGVGAEAARWVVDGNLRTWPTDNRSASASPFALISVSIGTPVLVAMSHSVSP